MFSTEWDALSLYQTVSLTWTIPFNLTKTAKIFRVDNLKSYQRHQSKQHSVCTDLRCSYRLLDEILYISNDLGELFELFHLFLPRSFCGCRGFCHRTESDLFLFLFCLSCPLFCGRFSSQEMNDQAFISTLRSQFPISHPE